MTHASMEPLNARLMLDGSALIAEASTASAQLVWRNKLVIEMGDANSVNVERTQSGKTRVTVYRRGLKLLQQSFSKVRSIDVTGSPFDDYIVLSQRLQFATVHTGAGDDAVAAYCGDVVIYGGDGDDRFSGRDGNDSLYGEAGNDRLYGAGGDDLLVGGGGQDFLMGSAGKNRLVGGSGIDQLTVSIDDTTDDDARDHLRELFFRGFDGEASE